MRWQTKTARATNATRGTVVGQRIRVAETGLTRIVGLLGERELQPGDGLLIVPSQGVHTMGMQFPIDIAVLDNDWKVIAIRHEMRPFRMTRMFWKAAAVLELPSGALEATSTLVGDRIEFDRVDVAARSVEKLSMWRRKAARSRRGNGQEGQSLVETAIALPLLLGVGFNIINWGYLWFMVLALSAAPRMGVQYATQGGAAGTSVAPGTTAVRDLVWENVTNAVQGSSTSSVAVQVCSSTKGVNSTTGITLCDQFGPAYSFPAPAADPEQPVYVLDRVDVEYSVTPIIPGAAFTVILPPNLNFHRQVSMRSLY